MMKRLKLFIKTHHFFSPDNYRNEEDFPIFLLRQRSNVNQPDRHAGYQKKSKFLEWIVVFFIFSILLFSCYNRERVPSKIIQPNEMGNIMWDMMRAQSLASEIVLKDSTVDLANKTKRLSQKVFEIHKTDSAQFNKSYSWYIKHPDVLKRIFDSVFAQKQREDNQELKKNQIHHRPK